MSNNPEEYLFESIEECCIRWYSWDKENCYASDPNYVDPTDTLYYPDWSQDICRNDGNAPAYIRAQSSFWMFGTYFHKMYYINFYKCAQLSPIHFFGLNHRESVRLL